jgi:ribosomal protein S18 acetylase RimI-like enzyme
LKLPRKTRRMAETEGLTIRPAGEDDARAVLDLWKVADAAPSVTDDEGSIVKLLARDPSGLLVACIDDRIVGSLVAVWDGWRGNMYRLAVHPDLRRRGIARALVEAGEKRLRSAGARRVTALVLHDQDHAVDFWRAVGYERDPRVNRHVRTL